MLMPHFGYQADEGGRWMRWLNWLRTRRLDGISTRRAQIEPVEIAKRLERLERVRWRREFRRRDVLRGQHPDRRRTAGLNWDFLETAFGWLWWERGEPNPLWDDVFGSRGRLSCRFGHLRFGSITDVVPDQKTHSYQIGLVTT